MYMHILSTDL